MDVLRYTGGRRLWKNLYSSIMYVLQTREIDDDGSTEQFHVLPRARWFAETQQQRFNPNFPLDTVLNVLHYFVFRAVISRINQLIY